MISEVIDAKRWFDALRWLIDVKQAVQPLSVPILDDHARDIGELRPITVRTLDDHALLERFVVWRNQNRLGYLDQRPVTLEGVRRYVEDVVFNPTRLTFLAYFEGKPVARLGAVRIGPLEHESDGLVRGERGGGIRFVYFANVAAMVFLFGALNQKSMISRVLSTNELARDSCASLGYNMQPIATHPIYRKQHADGITLETCGDAAHLVKGLTLDTIRVHRDAFFQSMCGRSGFSSLAERIQSLLSSQELSLQ